MVKVKTPVQILKDARRLLVTKGWTRGVFFRDAKRRKLGTSRGAACFCSMGAILHAGIGSPDGTLEARNALQTSINQISVFIWNDAQKSKHSVLKAFDRAIELAGGAQ